MFLNADFNKSIDHLPQKNWGYRNGIRASNKHKIIKNEDENQFFSAYYFNFCHDDL